MEKLSDFFSELKERISNPFILSYLLGWCIWNYEIVVGLIFYKNDELKKDGYNSYLDLILCHQSTWHFFWLPFISAVGYTFVFPFVKNGILAFGVWMDSWGGELNRKISKVKTVEVERFLQQEDKYQKALDKVSNYVDSETAFNLKLNELNLTIKEKDNQIANDQLTHTEEIKNLTDKLHLWAERQNVSKITGDWNLKTEISPKFTETFDSVVTITGANFHVNVKDVPTVTYLIDSVIGNVTYMVVFYKPINAPSLYKDRYWKLRIDDDHRMSGTDENGNKLTFEKKVQRYS